jgi:protein-S-isoprenylcysteine O-methyltransferase Ste14
MTAIDLLGIQSRRILYMFCFCCIHATILNPNHTTAPDPAAHTPGKEGVYYGVRLGRRIPWYEGFPFTVVPHPQYVGCILCIWGVTAVLFSQAAVNAGLLTVSCVWTGYYVFTGLIEHFF